MLDLDLVLLKDLVGDGSIEAPVGGVLVGVAEASVMLDFVAARSSTTEVSSNVVLFLFFSAFFCDKLNATSENPWLKGS